MRVGKMPTRINREACCAWDAQQARISSTDNGCNKEKLPLLLYAVERLVKLLGKKTLAQQWRRQRRRRLSHTTTTTRTSASCRSLHQREHTNRPTVTLLYATVVLLASCSCSCCCCYCLLLLPTALLVIVVVVPSRTRGRKRKKVQSAPGELG